MKRVVIIMVIALGLLIIGMCLVAGCTAPNAPIGWYNSSQSGKQIKIDDDNLIDIYYIQETDCLCHVIYTGNGAGGISCYPCQKDFSVGRQEGCPP